MSYRILRLTRHFEVLIGFNTHLNPPNCPNFTILLFKIIFIWFFVIQFHRLRNFSYHPPHLLQHHYCPLYCKTVSSFRNSHKSTILHLNVSWHCRCRQWYKVLHSVDEIYLIVSLGAHLSLRSRNIYCKVSSL